MKNISTAIILLSIIVSFGCGKNRPNRTITFYTTNENQVPAEITIDGHISYDRQIITLEKYSETVPINCNETNNSITINLPQGEHKVSWECDDNTEGSERITILNDCYIFEIGN